MPLKIVENPLQKMTTEYSATVCCVKRDTWTIIMIKKGWSEDRTRPHVNFCTRSKPEHGNEYYGERAKSSSELFKYIRHPDPHSREGSNAAQRQSQLTARRAMTALPSDLGSDFDEMSTDRVFLLSTRDKGRA